MISILYLTFSVSYNKASYMNPELRQIWGNFRAYHQFSRSSDNQSITTCRIYGDGVNIAARIESICNGGGVCISGTAFEHVENKLDLKYSFIYSIFRNDDRKSCFNIA